MNVMVEQTKGYLRENPLTSTFYHGAARFWTVTKIRIHEALHGRYYNASYFNQLFSKHPDPWGYRQSAISEARRELIVDTLSGRHYRRLLEVGCAEGWLTKKIAPVSDHVVAVDISAVAISRARQECRLADNVSFQEIDIATSSLPQGPFGCILCAGVLVFVDEAQQDRLLGEIVARLEIGGDLILEHTREAYPGEVAGKQIHALYVSHPSLHLISERHVDNYSIAHLRRVQ